MVGGVPNSRHLSGHAADYSGGDLNALLGEVQGYYGSRGRAAIHNGNHVHVDLPDYEVPYFGKRGTFGRRRR